MGEERQLYGVLVGNSKGKRLLGRPRRRWEVGMRMDLRETDWGMRSGFIWLEIGTDGGLYTAIKLWVLMSLS
jgi:hypothetical protein